MPNVYLQLPLGVIKQSNKIWVGISGMLSGDICMLSVDNIKIAFISLFLYTDSYNLLLLFIFCLYL